jgi:hypothetical protein
MGTAPCDTRTTRQPLEVGGDRQERSMPVSPLSSLSLASGIYDLGSSI